MWAERYSYYSEVVLWSDYAYILVPGLWHDHEFKFYRNGDIEYNGPRWKPRKSTIKRARQLFDLELRDFIVAVSQVLKRLPGDLERHVWSF
jgi:hypothetical protein